MGERSIDNDHHLVNGLLTASECERTVGGGRARTKEDGCRALLPSSFTS